jgi:hypothetical protein
VERDDGFIHVDNFVQKLAEVLVGKLAEELAS